MATVVAKEQLMAQGCYSVKYLDPDGYWQFSMDYNYCTGKYPEKNRWRCADSPTNPPSWEIFRIVPDHGYDALRAHFGLEESDVSNQQIVTMSPADLVRMRRAKEQREGLTPKVMQNMRMGCPKGELADTFEASS